MGSLLFSHLLRGDKLAELRPKKESAIFSWSPCPEDREAAKWMVQSQTGKKIVHYRVYIYCVLFDVSFLPFFFFLNHRHFRTTLRE